MERGPRLSGPRYELGGSWVEWLGLVPLGCATSAEHVVHSHDVVAVIDYDVVCGITGAGVIAPDRARHG